MNWSVTTYDSGIIRTKHLVYVTANAPTTTDLYKTVMDVACITADSKKGDNEILAGLFAAFEPLQLRKRDGKGDEYGDPMKYWGPVSSRSPAGPGVVVGDDIRYFTLRYLLDNSDGRCGAWSELNLAAIKVHGISADKYPIRPYQTPQNEAIAFEGKSYKAIGTAMLLDPATLGQGNSDINARTFFANHCMVKAGNKIWDPSYGKKWNDLWDWKFPNLKKVFFFELVLTVETRIVQGVPKTYSYFKRLKEEWVDFHTKLFGQYLDVEEDKKP